MRCFLQHPFYGSRQMVRHLRREGLRVGRHRVGHLMRLLGLQALYPAPRTSAPHPAHRVYPYLLRDLVIERPDQVWCADITYIPVRRGFLYLVAIMDWASRHVLAWRLSNTLDAGFCVEALDDALARHGPPEIFNTDQGSQFTGASVIKCCYAATGMYTTAEAAVLRKSANTRTSLSHQTTRRRDSKMSRKVSRREASPACIAGVRVSRPNFSAPCGRTKL